MAFYRGKPIVGESVVAETVAIDFADPILAELLGLWPMLSDDQKQDLLNRVMAISGNNLQ